VSEIEKAFSEGEWLKLGVKERLSIEKRLGISYIELQELFLMAKKSDLFETSKEDYAALKKEYEIQKQQLEETAKKNEDLLNKVKQQEEANTSLCAFRESTTESYARLQRSYETMKVELNNVKVSLERAHLRLEEAKKKQTT